MNEHVRIRLATILLKFSIFDGFWSPFSPPKTTLKKEYCIFAYQHDARELFTDTEALCSEFQKKAKWNSKYFLN